MLFCVVCEKESPDKVNSFERIVYWDGTEETATIEAEGETETDQAETESAGEGTGLFAMELQEDDSIGIFWKDETFGNADVNMFVKAE